MGRHSNGKNTYAVSGWVIAVAVLAVVALIAGVVWLVSNNGSESADNADGASEMTSSVPAGEGQDSAAEETSAESDGEESESAEASSTEPSGKTSTTASEAPDASAAVEAADTLILVDTSDGMAASFDAVSADLASTANGLGSEGKQVALWNYSSPLNPGVVVGYRQNLGFGDSAEAAGAVTRFGTGGVPQTRSAVAAALATASDQAQDTGSPARVLLVTSGTEQDMNDEQFSAALEEARRANVELSVVHVGANAPDAAIESAADHFSVVDNASDGEALSQALNKAVGL